MCVCVWSRYYSSCGDINLRVNRGFPSLWGHNDRMWFTSLHLSVWFVLVWTMFPCVYMLESACVCVCVCVCVCCLLAPALIFQSDKLLVQQTNPGSAHLIVSVVALFVQSAPLTLCLPVFRSNLLLPALLPALLPPLLPARLPARPRDRCRRAVV